MIAKLLFTGYPGKHENSFISHLYPALYICFHGIANNSGLGSFQAQNFRAERIITGLGFPVTKAFLPVASSIIAL